MIASNCSGDNPARAATGSTTTGRIQSITAGDSKHVHSQYPMTRSNPSLFCSARHRAFNSVLSGQHFFRRMRSMIRNPPAARRLRTATPMDQISTITASRSGDSGWRLLGDFDSGRRNERGAAAKLVSIGLLHDGFGFFSVLTTYVITGATSISAKV